MYLLKQKVEKEIKERKIKIDFQLDKPNFKKSFDLFFETCVAPWSTHIDQITLNNLFLFMVFSRNALLSKGINL